MVQFQTFAAFLLAAAIPAALAVAPAGSSASAGVERLDARDAAAGSAATTTSAPTTPQIVGFIDNNGNFVDVADVDVGEGTALDRRGFGDWARKHIGGTGTGNRWVNLAWAAQILRDEINHDTGKNKRDLEEWQGQRLAERGFSLKGVAKYFKGSGKHRADTPRGDWGKWIDRGLSTFIVGGLAKDVLVNGKRDLAPAGASAAGLPLVLLPYSGGEFDYGGEVHARDERVARMHVARGLL